MSGDGGGGLLLLGLGGGEFDLVSFSYHNGFPAAEVMVSKIKSSYGYSVHTRN